MTSCFLHKSNWTPSEAFRLFLQAKVVDKFTNVYAQQRNGPGDVTKHIDAPCTKRGPSRYPANLHENLRYDRLDQLIVYQVLCKKKVNLGARNAALDYTPKDCQQKGHNSNDYQKDTKIAKVKVTMAALKCLVFLLAFALAHSQMTYPYQNTYPTAPVQQNYYPSQYGLETVRSYPLPTRYVRSINLQVQPSYGYPLRYPYGTAFPVQPRPGFPNAAAPPPFGNSQIYPVNRPNYPQIYPITPSNYPSPTGGSQIYPVNQPNNPVIINPPYPPFGSFYPQFPNYPYPSYPSYPFQSNFPNYPDPFAHIPTEIIDVDENGNFNPESSWEDSLPKVEISSSQHSTSSEPSRPVSTQIIESNPIQTTITRTFDSQSSEPKVDVQYTNSDSNSGSGTLRAGKDWLYGVLNRHRNISLKDPEKTSIAPAKRFNRTAVSKFYGPVNFIYEKHNLFPNDIYNVDETGVLTFPNKQSKVVALRGKNKWAVCPWLKEEAAVMQAAITGFKKTGIYPFNRDVFPEHLFAPFETTERPQTAELLQAAKDLESQSSTSFCGSLFSISPRMLMPSPQEEQRVRTKNNRIKGKTALLTSSPYKQEKKTPKRRLFNPTQDKKGSKTKKGKKKEKTANEIKTNKEEKKVIQKLSLDEEDHEACMFCNVVIQEEGEECAEGQIRIEGKCSNRTRNVIQVPGKCPEGQDVGANNECFSEFKLPIPEGRIIAPPERGQSGRSSSY
ncbi:hypothetical protein ILUMI_01045 [Ignelater luminosus]|uniref:Uncharacterized protein n=1 Tax=Ignelater luminosus TaxID=2038154 RepID=A0A8K0DKU3_IGNLU|nr:hypothetical protein ILUMI_01045 [Ignelater luminosus]